MKNIKITKKEVMDNFRCDENGILYRLKSSGGSLPNKPLGCICPEGYLVVGFNYKIHRVHRIVWIYFNDEIPDGMEIDHINGIRIDNKPSNLRVATKHENSQNVKRANSNSKTGVLGVSYCKERDMYQASISIKKRYIRKFFKTIDEAKDFYLETKRKIHEFNTL